MGVVLYGSCGAFTACFLTIFQTLVIKVEHSLTIFLLKQNYVPCILQLTMIYNRKGDLYRSIFSSKIFYLFTLTFETKHMYGRIDTSVIVKYPILGNSLAVSFYLTSLLAS